MNQKDKDSLTALLDQNREVYQGISRNIHWSPSDAEYLDTLASSRSLQEDIAHRIMKISGSRISIELVPIFLVYKAWQRTKAVYSFNREIVNAMSQTDDTSLYVSLLERLPFKDILFFFPNGVLPKTNGEETAGMYIHLEKQPDKLWTIISYIDRKADNSLEVFPGILFAFPIVDGMRISQIFDTPEYQKCMSSYKRTLAIDQNLNNQSAEERLSAERMTLSIAINLMYYLSSKNADVKIIRNRKKTHKTASGKINTPAIKHYEVGSEYAEIVYRYLKEEPGENEDDPDDISGIITVKTENSPKKRRPHARRAHWQHYWTGKGRTTREVRWISDLFVGANRDDQATIVYDTSKGSHKRKRKPSLS